MFFFLNEITSNFQATVQIKLIEDQSESQPGTHLTDDFIQISKHENCFSKKKILETGFIEFCTSHGKFTIFIYFFFFIINQIVQ